ncbi:MAG TPA: GNAT family N-acetyltransferase [Thermoanaerobaculia bacterium]
MIDQTEETEAIDIRALDERDLKAIIDIDASSSRRRRPEYFRSVFQRSKQSPMQVSLVAEIDGIVTGFVMASLFYGEYGIAEPTASIDAVGVAPDGRRHGVGHVLMRQLLSNLTAVGVTTIRTEVAWSDLALLGFFKNEGFAPAPRLCLELKVAN